MKKTIPDLRADHHQITLDHCYVLLKRLADSMDLIDGSPGLNGELVNQIDPALVQEELEKYLKAPEFSRLYNSELGQGVLVGIYLSWLFKDCGWGLEK